jgi:HEAT repeat protein
LQLEIDSLEIGARSQRRQAAASLGQLGPAAQSAVPALIEALGDGEEFVQWEAAEALLQVVAPPPDARRALAAALRSKPSEVRDAVRKALANLQSELVPAPRELSP